MAWASSPHQGSTGLEAATLRGAEPPARPATNTKAQSQLYHDESTMQGSELRTMTTSLNNPSFPSHSHSLPWHWEGRCPRMSQVFKLSSPQDQRKNALPLCSPTRSHCPSILPFPSQLPLSGIPHYLPGLTGNPYVTNLQNSGIHPAFHTGHSPGSGPSIWPLSVQDLSWLL